MGQRREGVSVVLICGGREFRPHLGDEAWLGATLAVCDADTVIHGAARGADRWGGAVARALGLDVHERAADWHRWGNAAGPIRNQAMLDEFHPHFVVAMRGGTGTADMIRRAEAAGIPVFKRT